MLARHANRNVPGVIRFDGLDVRYTDLLSFYMEYKDIFLNRIYHFGSESPSPVIIDGGGCIGMSVLYFKSVYPQAKVICFEPDPDMFGVLGENVAGNRLEDVELVMAGLSGSAGTASFHPDGLDGGKMAEGGNGEVVVNTVRLSEYLGRPVDFLKLNIEGQELAVLREVEASGKFDNIRELVLEYHGWPDREQGLGEILAILDRQGFRYLVHDFDRETCPSTKPPFHMDESTAWYCLVYAKRTDGIGETGQVAR